MTHADLREECCEANRRLGASRLVDLTFGNVSVFNPAAAVFAIKPSGVAYGDLRPESIVVLDLEGAVVAGALRPSSDTPTHRRLYRAFEGIGAIVHTHSRHATSFAQAGREIRCLGTTHADYFDGAVPVTRAMTAEEIKDDYEWNTGQVIVERFAGMAPLAVPAVLVRHHGPFAWGHSGLHAIETAEALEIVAEMARHCLDLARDADEIPPLLRDRHYRRKHGPGATYGQRT